MKHSNFSVGVVDFFAALLPGALATWLLLQYVNPADLRRWSTGFESTGEIGRAAFLFLSAYALGHFVFSISASLLDPWYDRWRERRHPKGEDPTYQAADELRKRLSKPIGDSTALGAYSTLKWARAYATIHAPQTRTEIDGFEANSKFFRSLVVLFALVGAHFLLHEQRAGIATLCAALVVLSWQRYVDQRWKLTQLTFATAVILEGTKVGRGAKSTPDAAGEAASDDA